MNWTAQFIAGQVKEKPPGEPHPPLAAAQLAEAIEAWLAPQLDAEFLRACGISPE